MFMPLLLYLLSPALGAAVVDRAAAPSVTLKNGTVIGSSSNGIDTFNGIPFAEKPIGALRLKPPHTITKTYSTIMATGTPTACPQFLGQLNTTFLSQAVLGLLTNDPLFEKAQKTGEDCLTLNIQRPSTATALSKLPVVVWIYGGGFEEGSTQSFDASNLIEKSVTLGKPIIYAALNYRLGGFGFLAGKEVQKDGATNLGLRDQRLAMEWIADNIEAFGGDPSKITLWGESAGSISVFDQTIINGGNNTYKGKPLFRGAMMDSGSVIPTDPVTAPQAQKIYNLVVHAAGCEKSPDTLECLRKLPFQKLQNAFANAPAILGFRSVDLSYLPRPDPKDNFFALSPSISFVNGAYTRVPIIIGDQEDEGTLFSLAQSNISTTDQLVTYLKSYFPHATKEIISKIVATYPDNAAAGSPFRTGDLNEVYPQFKRLAAILGDATFTLSRRLYLSRISTTVASWSYLASYFHGTPVLGTFHGSDVTVAYGSNDAQPVATNAIQTYYISFINYLDPNVISTTAPLIEWPQWNPKTKMLMHFEALQNSLLADTFRSKSYRALLKYHKVLSV